MIGPAAPWGKALAAPAVLLVALAGCAIPSADGSRVAGPSQNPSARCELSADASPAATIAIVNRTFGPEVTVRAEDAVAFVSQDNTAHTVTEGTSGHAADNSCARQRLPPHGATAVIFHMPGDYAFTCTIHATMQTTVHVR